MLRRGLCAGLSCPSASVRARTRSGRAATISAWAITACWPPEMIVAGEDKRQRHRTSGWWGDKTFADLFFANAVAHPDRLALVDAPNRGDFAFGEPQRLTYAELEAEIDRIAGALVTAGLGKDDVLLVQLPNISEFVALYFAAAQIGAIVSP